MKQRLANEYSNGQCPNLHNISNACLKYLKFLYFIFFSQNTDPMVVTIIRDGMEAGRGREGRSCGIRTCTCGVIYTRQRQPGELIKDQLRDTPMNQPEPRKKFPSREGDSIYSFVQILSYFYNFGLNNIYFFYFFMKIQTYIHNRTLVLEEDLDESFKALRL